MTFAQTVTGSSNDATANGGRGGAGGDGGNATAINNFYITYIEINNSGPISITSSGPTEINSSGPTSIVSSGPTGISGSGLGGLSFITTVTGGAGGAGGVGGNGGSATAGGGGLAPLDSSVILASVGEGINTRGNGGVGGGGAGILAGGMGDILTVTGAGGDLVTLASVPEPASLALLGTGLAGLGLIRRRKAAG